MVNWKTELTSCEETLGLVDIRRGIFQGGSLSPRLDSRRLPGPVFDPPRKETAGRVTR